MIAVFSERRFRLVDVGRRLKNNPCSWEARCLMKHGKVNIFGGGGYCHTGIIPLGLR